jgi:hypothetical protein
MKRMVLAIAIAGMPVAAHADWSVTRDHAVCSARTTYPSGASVSFGHIEDPGIFHFSLSGVKWFTAPKAGNDSKTIIDIAFDGAIANIGFDGGRWYYTVRADEADQRVSFQLTAEMYAKMQSGNVMQIRSQRGEQKYSIDIDLKGAALAAREIAKCQAIADAENPGDEVRVYSSRGQKVVYSQKKPNLIISMSNLDPEDTDCPSMPMAGKVVHVEYGPGAIVPVGVTIEDKDGVRDGVGLPATDDMWPMVARTGVIAGLQRLFRVGAEVNMTVKRCGAAGRRITLDAIAAPTSWRSER